LTYDIQRAARRRTRRIVIGAGVAVLIAALSAAVTALTLDRGGSGQAATSPPATAPGCAPFPPETAASSVASGSALGTVTWSDLRGIALPVSASHGPADTARGRAVRFTHDRAGAVLAALHISARAAALVGPSVFRPTILEQVVGPDADELLANVEVDYEQRRTQAGLGEGQPLPESQAALAGYRVDTASRDTVSLRLLMSSPGASEMGTVYVAFRLEVRWTTGDWRLVAPPDGDWQNSTAQVASTAGYIPFPGR
jgi:hypothetical protein